DVKSMLERSDTTWTLAVASVDYAAYQPEIKPTEENLTAFYEQAGGRYDIPPQVAVSYLDFPSSRYLPSVNVTEEEVRAFYDANPARFPKAAGAPSALLPTLTSPESSDDYAAVRSQVEAE